MLSAQGDLAAAKQHYEQALDILEEHLGPDHPATNIVRKDLKAVTAKLGQINEPPKSIE